MVDIHHLVRIKGPPEQVFEAPATANGIRKWWTRDVELESKVGATGELRFYEGQGVTRLRVKDLAPATRVAWTVLASNAPGGWDDTTITFDLRADGDETVVSLAHCGFAEVSEGYALVSTGWAYYLVSLQQYIETGRGAPQQEKNFSRVTGRVTEIALTLNIRTTPERLYEAITTQTGLAAWYTPETRAEAKVGALVSFGFSPETTTLTFRVDRLDPPHHVAWSGVDVPLDWKATRLTFDMAPAGDVVELTFIQSGLPFPYEAAGCFSYLWGQYLRSLKAFLETGRGEPYGSEASKTAGTTPPQRARLAP